MDVWFCIPTSNEWELLLLHVLASTDVSIPDFSYSSRCVMVSCCFVMHFCDDIRCGTRFCMFIFPLCIFFDEMPVKIVGFFDFFQSVLDWSQEKDHISKRKIGLNVRTVGFKIYIVKYAQNGKKPGKHSVEFSILLPTSTLQSVCFLVLKCHALQFREGVCLSHFYINKTFTYETCRILIWRTDK